MYNILLIDDSKTIQKVVELTVKDIDGIELFLSFDSEHAFNILGENRIDLLFVDVNLPDNNGYSIVKELRKDEAYSDIPIYLIWGTFEEFDAQLAISSGASGFFRKPFESEFFLSIINCAKNNRPVLSTVEINNQTIESWIANNSDDIIIKESDQSIFDDTPSEAGELAETEESSDFLFEEEEIEQSEVEFAEEDDFLFEDPEKGSDSEIIEDHEDEVAVISDVSKTDEPFYSDSDHHEEDGQTDKQQEIYIEEELNEDITDSNLEEKDIEIKKDETVELDDYEIAKIKAKKYDEPEIEKDFPEDEDETSGEKDLSPSAELQDEELLAEETEEALSEEEEDTDSDYFYSEEEEAVIDSEEDADTEEDSVEEDETEESEKAIIETEEEDHFYERGQQIEEEQEDEDAGSDELSSMETEAVLEEEEEEILELSPIDSEKESASQNRDLFEQDIVSKEEPSLESYMEKDESVKSDDKPLDNYSAGGKQSRDRLAPDDEEAFEEAEESLEDTIEFLPSTKYHPQKDALFHAQNLTNKEILKEVANLKQDFNTRINTLISFFQNSFPNMLEEAIHKMLEKKAQDILWETIPPIINNFIKNQLQDTEIQEAFLANLSGDLSKAFMNEITTKIVSRIDIEVIEEKASKILENICWEVVPNLSEILIKNEIEKLKREE